MHRSAQDSGSLTMNNPYLQDVSVPAFFEIIREQIFDVRRMEGVQVKDTVDGNADRHGRRGALLDDTEVL